MEPIGFLVLGSFVGVIAFIFAVCPARQRPNAAKKRRIDAPTRQNKRNRITGKTTARYRVNEFGEVFEE